MQGIPYTVMFEGSSVTNANGDYDLFELACAANRMVEIVGMNIAVTSELQEAQEEWLRIAIIRGHTTSGNGTATTPRPTNPNAPAAGMTAETLGATIASAGTGVTLFADGFNVRAGYQLPILPSDVSLTTTNGAGLLVVRLMAAVTDDVTMSGTLWVVEY
jgi:hypothetical protein